MCPGTLYVRVRSRLGRLLLIVNLVSVPHGDAVAVPLWEGHTS